MCLPWRKVDIFLTLLVLLCSIFKLSRETHTIISVHKEGPHTAVQFPFIFWALFHGGFDLIPFLSQLCIQSHASFFRLVKQCSYSHRAQGNGAGGKNHCALVVGCIRIHPCIHSLSPLNRLVASPAQTTTSWQGKLLENRESLDLLYWSLLGQQQCCLSGALPQGLISISSFIVHLSRVIKLTSQTHC